MLLLVWYSNYHGCKNMHFSAFYIYGSNKMRAIILTHSDNSDEEALHSTPSTELVEDLKKRCIHTVSGFLSLLSKQMS